MNSSRESKILSDGVVDFKKALSLFATGVLVASTVDDDGCICGITINSFNSLSLKPKLVLFSMQTDSLRFRHFPIGCRFSLSFLAHGQAEVSSVFSSYNEGEWKKYLSFSNEDNDTFITGSLGYLVLVLKRVYLEGDHYLLISEVIRHIILKVDKPLIFFNSSYA